MTPRSQALADPALLEVASRDAKSMADMMRRLGLRVHGKNYDAVRLACEQFGIELPTYDRSSVLRRSRPLEEILVVDSTYENSKSLKRRLVREGVLQERCSECELFPTWNGKPLTLQLEHVNGIHNDNRIDNLCLLCPNCHSQTATYAGGNSRQAKVAHLCACGKKRSRQGRECRECFEASSAKRQKIEWPPTPVILEQVNLLGWAGAARKLGVSDNAVRKHVAKHS